MWQSENGQHGEAGVVSASFGMDEKVEGIKLLDGKVGEEQWVEMVWTGEGKTWGSHSLRKKKKSTSIKIMQQVCQYVACPSVTWEGKVITTEKGQGKGYEDGQG